MGSGKTIRRRKRDGVNCLSCLVQDVHGGRARTCELQQEEEECCCCMQNWNWKVHHGQTNKVDWKRLWRKFRSSDRPRDAERHNQRYRYLVGSSSVKSYKANSSEADATSQHNNTSTLHLKKDFFIIEQFKVDGDKSKHGEGDWGHHHRRLFSANFLRRRNRNAKVIITGRGELRQVGWWYDDDDHSIFQKCDI